MGGSTCTLHVYIKQKKKKINIKVAHAAACLNVGVVPVMVLNNSSLLLLGSWSLPECSPETAWHLASLTKKSLLWNLLKSSGAEPLTLGV